MTTMFSPDETRRYSRHLVLKGVGGAGQQKLKGAKVLVIGAGGLGSPVISYLAAAGVGTLGVVDDDRVALSNLQRQVIHTTSDVESLKAKSAGRHVAALNPNVDFRAHCGRFGGDSAAELLRGYDILVDGTDNFATRVEAADLSERHEKPLVSGAVSMFDGQVTVFMPGSDRPKFRDLYPIFPGEGELPSCEAVGVLGAVTGVIGTLMAMECLKLILGHGEVLVGRLLLYDGTAARFHEVAYG